MTPLSGRILLLALGSFVLATVASGRYVNYVRPGMRVVLLATGVVLLLLAVHGALTDWRRRDRARIMAASPSPEPDPDGHHAHDGMPRVSWLLAVPAVFFALLAPPSLGAFSAARAVDAAVVTDQVEVIPADSGWQPLPAAPVVALPVSEYVARALWDPNQTLAGRRVRLVGFVTVDEGGRWFVTRMSIQCCAGDASAWRVAILTSTPPPAVDTWVEVEGTWVATELPVSDEIEAPARLRAVSVREVVAPENPYE